MLAKKYGKPVVGNSDVHKLKDFGRTYTLIDASVIDASTRAPKDAFGTKHECQGNIKTGVYCATI